MTTTTGQTFTAEIRKMMAMNSRTRWGRKDSRFTPMQRAAILERIREDLEYGTADDTRLAIWQTAYTALSAYAKFIDGYRIDGMLRFHIMERSPWEFAAFLGDMIDSGCTNMGEFEDWFSRQSRAASMTT